MFHHLYVKVLVIHQLNQNNKTIKNYCPCYFINIVKTCQIHKSKS